MKSVRRRVGPAGSTVDVPEPPGVSGVMWVVSRIVSGAVGGLKLVKMDLDQILRFGVIFL